MTHSKQLIQTDNPAMKGRRDRIEELRKYIEANRKKKYASQILNEFCVETGLRISLVKEYFKLLVAATIYVNPSFETKWKILTPKELKKIR